MQKSEKASCSYLRIYGLVSEIDAASKEQADGIEQVNNAVAEMNKVTQQNAANSEESASASEELNSQAQELSSLIGTFDLTSNGNGQAYQTPPARVKALSTGGNGQKKMKVPATTSFQSG